MELTQVQEPAAIPGLDSLVERSRNERQQWEMVKLGVGAYCNTPVRGVFKFKGIPESEGAGNILRREEQVSRRGRDVWV